MSPTFIGSSLPGYQRTDIDIRGLKGSIRSIMETKYAVVEDESSDSAIVKDTVIYQRQVLYNEFGFETAMHHYMNGVEVASQAYEFGAGGRKIALNKYDGNGTHFLRITYTYDEKGYCIGGVYDWLQKGIYNAISDKEELGIEDIDENLVMKVVYENNFRGLRMEERFLNMSGDITYRNTFRYDYLDKKVEMTYYRASGRVSWRTKYKYDRYGDLDQMRLFKDNRTAIESNFDYEYDSTGNWTSRYEHRRLVKNIMTAHLKGGNTITERTIEYYQTIR
jgi:hypothetical protein